MCDVRFQLEELEGLSAVVVSLFSRATTLAFISAHDCFNESIHLPRILHDRTADFMSAHDKFALLNACHGAGAGEDTASQRNHFEGCSLGCIIHSIINEKYSNGILYHSDVDKIYVFA